jgi:hypothetical protein
VILPDLGTSGTTTYKVTVTSTANNPTINSIETVKYATLDISTGAFTILNGTGSGTNAGTIDVGGTAMLDISGTFTNATTGLISAHASGAVVDFVGGSISGGKVNIAAGGTVGASLVATDGSSPSMIDAGTTISNNGFLDTNNTLLTLANVTVNSTISRESIAGGSLLTAE